MEAVYVSVIVMFVMVIIFLSLKINRANRKMYYQEQELSSLKISYEQLESKLERELHREVTHLGNALHLAGNSANSTPWLDKEVAMEIHRIGTMLRSICASKPGSEIRNDYQPQTSWRPLYNKIKDLPSFKIIEIGIIMLVKNKRLDHYLKEYRDYQKRIEDCPIEPGVYNPLKRL
jgi:hypothetical protein